MQADRRPSLARAPRGLEGLGAPRLLEVASDLWAIVADAPQARFDAAAIEPRLRDLDWVAAQATAHEAVVEHWLDKASIVPLRLFTLYTGDERAVAELDARAADIRRAIDATRGRREWAFKVTLDPTKARAAARTTAVHASEAAPSGSAFLARKKRERDAVTDAARRAFEEVDALTATLTKLAAGTVTSPPSPAAPSLLADATFLVEREREAQFLAAADAGCARLGTLGCEARVTGPWPPYVHTASSTGAGGGKA